ncbi:MAG: hypothetical protein ACPGRC_05860 [Salibacteraceae bacterium]
MKNLLIQLTTLAAFLIIGIAGFSQDKIYKINSEVILCTVTEIAEEEIKYTTEETGTIVYVIDKDRIEKVVLASGKELTFRVRMDDPELYAGQSSNAFKVGLFSPLMGALSLGYERSLSPGKSLEGTLGIIGVGRDINYENPKGAYVKLGMKFILRPDFTLKGMKYSHQLNGWYFRPELDMAFYSRDTQYGWGWGPTPTPPISSRKNVSAGAFMLNFGKQMVMSNVFLVDLYVGVGYGLDNNDSNYDPNTGYYENNSPYHYGFVMGEDVPFAATAGLKVGFLTK